MVLLFCHTSWMAPGSGQVWPRVCTAAPAGGGKTSQAPSRQVSVLIALFCSASNLSYSLDASHVVAFVMWP